MFKLHIEKKIPPGGVQGALGGPSKVQNGTIIGRRFSHYFRFEAFWANSSFLWSLDICSSLTLRKQIPPGGFRGPWGPHKGAKWDNSRYPIFTFLQLLKHFGPIVLSYGV